MVPHYQLVGPIVEQIFNRIPIVWTTPNPQANQPPIYHAKYFGHYSHLSSEHVQHLAAIGAQEFHSWFPVVEDRQRARFARFLLERPWADTQGALLESVRRSARIIGDLLKAEGYGATPVLDGVGANAEVLEDLPKAASAPRKPHRFLNVYSAYRSTFPDFWDYGATFRTPTEEWVYLFLRAAYANAPGLFESGTT